VHPDARVQASGRQQSLDQRVTRDVVVDRRVAHWLQRHAEEFCKRAEADTAWLGARPVTSACLDERLAVAETHLDASETKIRSQETSLGNWITDQMMVAFKDCRVDGAILNAGSLRLNQDIARDSPILMRHLQELIGYATPLRVFKVDHAQFRRVLANAISVPDAGRWLQVSDQIAFTYEPATSARPAKLLKVVLRPTGKPPIEITDTSRGEIRLVGNDYLADPKSVDGFNKILSPPNDAGCGAARMDLKAVLYAAFKAQGRIKADEAGRICTEDETRGSACRATQAGNTP
jgi:2',3'-cyclic-nucleotide 2'-phosphodiesterase (5'-nucleotidase family)